MTASALRLPCSVIVCPGLHTPHCDNILPDTMAKYAVLNLAFFAYSIFEIGLASLSETGAC